MNTEQMSILVVDDISINREFIVRQLRGMPFNVTEAADGARAIAAFLSLRYNLVLMDCHMPHIDGYRATQLIREHEATTGLPRVPIVAVTADITKGARERCIASGMDDYLTKPLMKNDLLSCLETWLTIAPA